MGLLDEAIREHLDLKRRRGADPTEIERAEREALGPVRREPVASMPMEEPTFAPEPVFRDERDERDEPESFDHDEPVEAPRPHKRRGFFGRSRHEPDVEDRAESLPDAPRRDPGFDEAVELALRKSAEEPTPRFTDEDEFDLPATNVYERPREPGDVAPPGYEAPSHGDDLEAAVGDDAGYALQDHAEHAPRADADLAFLGEADHAMPDETDRASHEEPVGHEPDEPSASIPRPVGAAQRPVAPPSDTLGETTEFDVEAENADPPADRAQPSPESGDVLEETPEFLQDTPDHDRLWFEQRPPRDFDFGG